MSDEPLHKPPVFSPRARRWLIALAVFVVLLYAAGLSPFWRFQRDSALYMGLARSLARHGTFSFDGQEHTYALPGFPAMLSLIYLTQGQDFLAMNALVGLFGLGCIALGYLLFRELELTPFQIAACTLLLAFSRTLYYYSSMVMTDVPFAFFATAALYAGTRSLRAQGRARWGWWLAAAAAALAACTIRPLGPTLLIALAAALYLQRGARQRLRQSAAMTAVLLAPPLAAGALWALRGARFGAPFGSSYVSQFLTSRGPLGVARHVIGNLPSLAGSFSGSLLGSNVGVSISLVLAALMALGLHRALRRGERLLSVYGVVYLGVICLSGPGPRYMLPALPTLFYWLVLGAGEVGGWLARRGATGRLRTATGRLKTATGRLKTATGRLKTAGVVLLAMGLLPNVAHLSKSVYEAHLPDFYAVAEQGVMSYYFPLTNWLREHAGPQDLVLTGEGNVVYYFSGVRTFQLRAVKAAGRPRAQLYVLEHLPVTYVVVDHTYRRPERSLAALPRALPHALKRVGTFGKVELFRVHRDILLARHPWARLSGPPIPRAGARGYSYGAPAGAQQMRPQPGLHRQDYGA